MTISMKIAAIDENGVRSLSEDEIGSLIARMSRADDIDVQARSAVERVSERAQVRRPGRAA